jgi:hypothetical protein
MTAHRRAYELHHKVDLDVSLDVHHTCNNKSCCNPKHLKSVPKDLHAFLEGHKLIFSFGVAEDIRRRVDSGEAKKKIAREFGVNPRSIVSICRNTQWSPENAKRFAALS